MEILENAPQGSAPWHAARATRFCASEAAAAMSVSKYTTRTELLTQKKTGIAPEVSEAKQRLFNAGHAAEAAALEIAEGIAGVEFYPAVGTAEVDGLPLLASFDGIDMLEEVIWENKLLNASLIEQVARGDLEPHYWAQLEHQLLVSGARKALFTTSNGTAEGTHQLWYESVPERRAKVIAAWKQFAVDLAAYVPPAPAEPKPQAKAREALPALVIEAKGEITAGNLGEYKANALSVLNDIPGKPKTDQEFADAKEDAKFCRDVQSAMEQAKALVLGRMTSVDDAIKAIDHIGEVARRKAIDLEGAVEAEEKRRKQQMVVDGAAALREHVDSLNTRLGKPLMPLIGADFAAAIKGKRNVESMQSAVDATLANAKIDANATADRIDANLKHLAAEAGEYSALFPDEATIVLKQPDDFRALVQFRVVDFKAKEDKRKAEELAKAAAAPAVVDAPAAAPAPAPTVIPLTRRATVTPTSKPTLSLGQLKERIAPIQLSAEGLSTLGFVGVKDRGSVLFHEAEYPHILAALVSHVQAIQAKQAA